MKKPSVGSNCPPFSKDKIKANFKPRPTLPNLRPFIKYLKFLLSSTNQYGVHSPFIYDYLTKCLYRRSRFKGKKTEKAILKSIDYFNGERLYLPKDRIPLKKRLKKEFPSLQFALRPYDFVVTDIIDFNTRFELISQESHNDTVCIIEHIHRNTHNESIWEQIKHRGEITVTIDMFRFGVVFFRKEQAREHFKIRL